MMNNIVVIVAMLVSLSSGADTLTLSNLSGVIYSHPELTPKGIKHVLEVREDGTIHFVRKRDSDLIWDLIGRLEDATVVEDILIIPLVPESRDQEFKLVMSGWISSSGLMLYGNVLVYKDGKQLTGVPVTLYRASNG